MKPSVVFAVLLLTSPVFAQSQSAPIASEQIVVTASAITEERDETPVAVEVITRQEIERREARDVADVLREVPGLAVTRTGSEGKITSLFVRGGSSKQALVLWNGVEMNNPYFSGYNFGQLSTAGVERIEVVRGPFSALYGSEAVSGVVHILTRPAGSGSSIDIEAGQNGLLNVAASGGFTSGNWNGHGAVERRQDDGFFANDFFESDTVLGGIEFAPRNGFSVGLTARHSSFDLGIPFAPDATFTAFEPRLRRGENGSETQLLLPIGYKRGNLSYELRLSQSERDDHFEDLDIADVADTDSRLRNARGSVSIRTAALGTLTVGGEYEESVVDHLSSFSMLDQRERSSESFFIEDRVSIPVSVQSSFEIVAGIRYDNYDTFGAETTPRLAAAWVSGPHKVRTGYGRAFRAPAIGELFSPFFGNPDLEAETSRTFEAGYDLTIEKTRLSVTYFNSEYEDLISFGPSFTFENIDLAKASGVEISARRGFGPWEIGGSYTFLDTEDEETGDPLVRRPEQSGSFFLGFVAGDFQSQLVVTHRGDRSDVTDITPFGKVSAEPYTLADLTVRYRLGSLLPYVKAENITDEEYQEVFGYPSPPRRFLAGLRYNWGR